MLCVHGDPGVGAGAAAAEVVLARSAVIVSSRPAMPFEQRRGGRGGDELRLVTGPGVVVPSLVEF